MLCALNKKIKKDLKFYIKNAYIIILIINTLNHSIYNINISATLIHKNFISYFLLIIYIFNSTYFYILNFFNIIYKLGYLLLIINYYNKIEIGE